MIMLNMIRVLGLLVVVTGMIWACQFDPKAHK